MNNKFWCTIIVLLLSVGCLFAQSWDVSDSYKPNDGNDYKFNTPSFEPSSPSNQSEKAYEVTVTYRIVGKTSDSGAMTYKVTVLAFSADRAESRAESQFDDQSGKRRFVSAVARAK